MTLETLIQNSDFWKVTTGFAISWSATFLSIPDLSLYNQFLKAILPTLQAALPVAWLIYIIIKTRREGRLQDEKDKR